jgi:hypothetical protein
MVAGLLMKIYYFSGWFEEIKNAHASGFDGILFATGIENADFVRVARCIDKYQNFTYMIAIRPYLISPQYLSFLCNSLDEISPGSIEINLISGWPKEHEREYGGVIGDVNDLSSNIDKSNYLIKFLDVFSAMKGLKLPKLFVSTTNKFTFDAAKKHDQNVILPYSRYISGEYDIDNSKAIVSIGPIFKDDDENTIHANHSDSTTFTKKEFADFLDDLNSKGFYGVLVYETNAEKKVMNFVKEYKALKFGGK